MSDLLLGANTTFNSLLQSTEPLVKLNEIMKNPASIFTGSATSGGNPFGQLGDFSQQQLSPLEQLGMLLVASEKDIKEKKIELEKPETPETPQEAPPLKLPDEGHPTGKEPIDDKYKKADGSTKSWQEIRDESPVCKNFGSGGTFKKDIKVIDQGLKEKFGDWENEKDPEKAARSYIKTRELLEYADNSKARNGGDRGKEANDGNLGGMTKSGDIRDGSELSTVINYVRHGKGFVEETTKGGQLKDTNDKFVRMDGSNRSNLGQFGVDVGKGISHVIPGLGNTIAGLADGFDKGMQRGDLGDGIKEGLKGGAKGAAYTAQNALKVFPTDTDLKGMVDGAKNMFNGSFANGL